MKSILVLTKFKVMRDPRPSRVAQCLRGHYNVSLVGAGEFIDSEIEFFPLGEGKRTSFFQKLVNLINRLVGHFDSLVDRLAIDSLNRLLQEKHFDLIFCHDIELLPQVLRAKKNARIIFDAREYYPAQYEDRFMWRLLEKKFRQYLCDTYMKQCDKVITVSDNIASRYAELLGAQVGVLQSWPKYHAMTPADVDENNIKIIHHGGANANRKIEAMIKMMDFVDKRFSLDLMLMYENTGYFNYLVAEANKRENVRIIEPVKFEDIIPFANQYDIGLFLCPPSTFNLKYSLPNKLFEFIQSRLLVAIGPSIEMQKVVRDYDLGIVSQDFSPESMAKALCSLNGAKIRYFKDKANEAARQLNADVNCEKIRSMVKELLVA